MYDSYNKYFKNTTASDYDIKLKDNCFTVLIKLSQI